MKKLWLMIGLILCLSACKDAYAPSQTASPDPLVTQTAAPEDKTIPLEKDEGQFEFMTRVEDCIYPISGADEEDEIVLFTDAKKDDQGEFMWDDSQNWALVVISRDGIYPLYEAYQHGRLHMNMSEYYEDGDNPVPVIRLSISTSAGFEIREYRYTDKKFTEKKAFETGEINEISINSYE